jgi:hypothetical protein
MRESFNREIEAHANPLRVCSPPRVALRHEPQLVVDSPSISIVALNLAFGCRRTRLRRWSNSYYSAGVDGSAALFTSM